MTRTNRQRTLGMLGAALAASLLLGGCGGTPADTAAGAAYLEQLEQRDPDAVDQVLRQRRLDALAAQREELIRQVKSGEQDPFPLFQDAVILGDSRAVGFFYYGFIDESRDLTGTGDTILNLPSKLDALEALNPRYVYLTYGLNDLKIGHWGSLEAHIADYMAAVQKIRERVPDAVIVISSILPYRDPVAQSSSSQGTGSTSETTPSSFGLTEADKGRLAKIPQWNELMEKTCKEFGLVFVDNDAICEEHKDLWEADGIHMYKAFYPAWGKNLVVAALEEGGIIDDEESVA